MKTSATKYLKVWINKKKSKKEIILSTVVTLLLLIIFTYFLKPAFYNYEADKITLERKISSNFKINTKVSGKIAYKIFPSPRIKLEKVKLGFGNPKGKKTDVDLVYILISPFNLSSYKNLKFNKLLIENQELKIYHQEVDNYLKFFTYKEKNNFTLKNCNIIFSGHPGNQINFTEINLNEKIIKKNQKVFLNGNFSNNKFKIKFLNEYGKEKKFRAEIPNLDLDMDINFTKNSNLENMSGKLKLTFLESIFLLNFAGDKNFLISDSFFRNKFLNSKINGNISFKNNFFFDLKLGINQINLRQLLLYYFSDKNSESKPVPTISKKINGKLEIESKSTNSFFGKIKNIKMLAIFENGDLKIQKGSINLDKENKVNFNLFFSNKNQEASLDFSINTFFNDLKKYLKKFDIYDFEDTKLSLFSSGSINLNKRNIKIKKLIKNGNESIILGDIKKIEEHFNNHVIKDKITDIFDFFKVKKFIKEVNSEFE